MLSAAHVLAMDAKNLLDVVDSIRARYPDLFIQQQQQQQQLSVFAKPAVPFNHDQYQTEIQHPIDISQYTQHRGEDSYEIMSRQTYQNMSNVSDSQLESTATSSIVFGGDEQIYANNQPNSGIYDNDCIISAQLSTNTSDSNQQSNTANGSSPIEAITTSAKHHSSQQQPSAQLTATSVEAPAPAKPPVAIKPTNLQSKFKVNLTSTNIPIIVEKKSLIDEPLKIIEPEQELYCNSSAIVE